MLIFFLSIKVCGLAARLGHRLFFWYSILNGGAPVSPLPALVVTLLVLWAVIWLLSRWGGGL
jgi:hypothetical protein